MEFAYLWPVRILEGDEVVPWVDVSICAARPEKVVDFTAALRAAYSMRRLVAITAKYFRNWRNLEKMLKYVNKMKNFCFELRRRITWMIGNYACASLTANW